MPGQVENPLASVARNLIVIDPLAIERWLLCTSRRASPDPEINTQARFAAALGRDAYFVSRIENGARLMPASVRDSWFHMIGLDREGVDQYLADRSVDAPSRVRPAPRSTDPEDGRVLFDAALHGVSLAQDQWAPACRAAATSGLPRTLGDFCAVAVEALVVASPADYAFMVTALAQLPESELVRSVDRVVQDVPSRGYQAVDLLAVLPGSYSGPLLLDYFRDLPDPWMLRSVAEAMRRLVEREHVTSLVDDVRGLQSDLVDSTADDLSWTSRIELANLATTLGPLPSEVRRRLAEDTDMDVRIAAGAVPDEAATAAVDHLYADGVLATLDAMPGRTPTEDPVARILVREMMVGRNRRRRIHAAQALGLSAYRDRVGALLTGLLGAASTELRRATAQALMHFPRSPTAVTALIRSAGGDPDADVRGRALWSLTPHAPDMDTALLDTLLSDADESVRRCAVDLAAAAGHLPGLLTAAQDPAPYIAADAAALAARIAPGPLG